MCKIFVPISRNNYKEVEVKNLLYCLGEGSYTTLYFQDESFLVVTKLLKEVEKILSKYNFFRVNNNHLINLSYIKSYSIGKEPKVVLNNEHEISISRRKKEEFRQKLSSTYIHV